jgi:hypothetical protein
LIQHLSYSDVIYYHSIWCFHWRYHLLPLLFTLKSLQISYLYEFMGNIQYQIDHPYSITLTNLMWTEEVIGGISNEVIISIIFDMQSLEMISLLQNYYNWVTQLIFKCYDCFSYFLLGNFVEVLQSVFCGSLLKFIEVLSELYFLWYFSSWIRKMAILHSIWSGIYSKDHISSWFVVI